MSELMTPISFRQLMTWIVAEHDREGSVFGVHRPFHPSGKTLPIFGETIETPFGPAAGPNTQLAQNIVAGYFGGARFFELKTVQKMDGAELAACINRPCILAEDECYNCEWSTELTVPQAFEEYVKAWCACKIMSKLYGLGDPNGFVFNMSVGYDLEGVKGEKVDTFLNGMMNAAETPIFQECISVLHELFPAEKDAIDAISPRISRSVTSPPSTAARRRRSSASPPISSRKRGCTPSSSATPLCWAMRPPAPFWMKWAMTISPLMTTTSRKICNTRTPSPCSTVWKNGLRTGVWNLASN